MAGWHHWLDGCESECTPGVGDGQGGLACCLHNSWGCKESDTAEWLNWTELNWFWSIFVHWFLKCQCSLCHLLFDHFQFTLIHGPNISSSYAILFFTASDFTFTTRHMHNWALFPLRLSLFIPSGAISLLFSSSIVDTYWPGEFIFQCHYLSAFSYCSWSSQGKNAKLVCHFLLQWTTFCLNSPPWPICLGWPYTAWFIVSLS